MKSAALLSTLLIVTALNTFAQNEEKDHAMWGKIALGQNFPNPVIYGEITTINYKAKDVNDVVIALYNEDNKLVHAYQDLYPGVGQIRVRRQLDPGKYTYVLFVNGRLVEKKIMEVVHGVASSRHDESSLEMR